MSVTVQKFICNIYSVCGCKIKKKKVFISQNCHWGSLNNIRLNIKNRTSLSFPNDCHQEHKLFLKWFS